ncbi:MAG: EmrA/EmrK family multidrug efflux transporter periplasmic adaptor subunit [Ramlibacter sp.]|nr:EmrA/EmrK family multidrug efflux transporter periplasmic adaptor subunit [Ramlibacter sp.]
MSTNTQEATADTGLKQRRNKRLLALAAVVVAIGGATGSYWKLHASHFVATDNAYTAVEVAQITPAIAGTVAAVRVKDTQQVKKGDVLIEIDPADARLLVAQAEAELDRAVRRVRSYQASDVNLDSQMAARAAEQSRVTAQVAAAGADFERARIDLQRREALVETGSVSADEVTRARNAHQAAQANLAAAKAATTLAAANLRGAGAARQATAALISGTTAETNPAVNVARARLAQARLDLERTVVRAPVDGVVAKRQVQLGQRVQPGMPLMAVVPVADIYVDANFKEVQLQKVRVGQPVVLHADLYGGDVSYRGTVVGFAGGSGSAFSAIPAQNATGNWIKVVQRLPVRVQLDARDLQSHPLKVGLSMSAEIDTRATGKQTQLDASAR